MCPVCGLEAGAIEQASAVQKAIADAFRKKKNLLTGEDIRSFRKNRGLTQKGLADLMNVGIASIKRWETGLIQSNAMDHALRIHLHDQTITDKYTGDREFSIERVKLVIRTFENLLKNKILKKTDKLLFAAKYLWYADMLSFRYLGRSMTGATYASLPYGPQLNNYNDLINEIKKANENLAEPLSKDEMRIINKVCDKFPTERKVYDAAHREIIWEMAPTGAIIPYTLSSKLTEI